MYTHGNTVVRTLQLRRPDIMYNMIQSAKTTCDGRWDVGGSRGALGSATLSMGCRAGVGTKLCWENSRRVCAVLPNAGGRFGFRAQRLQRSSSLWFPGDTGRCPQVLEFLDSICLASRCEASCSAECAQSTNTGQRDPGLAAEQSPGAPLYSITDLWTKPEGILSVLALPTRGCPQPQPKPGPTWGKD